MVGIISNIAAVVAQSNLRQASADSAASIARLSSGNRIDRAATDVAGLAIGTILKTNVSTLSAALTNASQAKSLLGVADGALKNIGELLQRQKALATQATSGTLGLTERGYLDQEFQGLTEQINQIASTTNFNGVKLIDGSLYTPAQLSTFSRENSVSTQGKLTMVGIGVNAETFTLNGVTFTFRTNAAAFSGDAPTQIVMGGSAAATASNLYDAIQNTLNTTNSSYFDERGMLAGLDFSLSGASITITSKAAGTNFNAAGGSAITINGNAVTASHMNVNGTEVNGAGALNLSASGTAGTGGGTTVGDLFSGTFATGGATAYSGTATTIAKGIIGDNILTAIDDNAAATAGITGFNDTGVNTRGVSNNSAFAGKISGFKASYSQDDYVNLEVKVGDYTYQAKNVKTTPGTAGAVTQVRLAAIENGGGFFDIQFNTGATSGLTTAVTTQAEADVIASRLDRALESLDFFQKRTISSYVAAGTIFPTGSTTSSGNLAGTKFQLINNDFSDLKIESISVKSPVSGGTEGVIQVVINGELFQSGYDNAGTTTALGSSIANSTTIGLVSTTDPRKVLTFANTSGGAIGLANASEAQGFQKALERAFGVGQGGSSLDFQIGVSQADSIKVQMQSAQTKDIFKDENGNVNNHLSVTTEENAKTAGAILDGAIRTVTSLRATVGALQSRFDYATTSIESSQANLDAARGTFLDTDIETESTRYATAQVRLQASISVLVQANQLPQSLLKLID